jgi:hypothetical protein
MGGEVVVYVIWFKWSDTQHHRLSVMDKKEVALIAPRSPRLLRALRATAFISLKL